MRSVQILRTTCGYGELITGYQINTWYTITILRLQARCGKVRAVNLGSGSFKSEREVEDAEVCLERHGVDLEKNSTAQRFALLFPFYTCLKLAVKSMQAAVTPYIVVHTNSGKPPRRTFAAMAFM